MTTLQTELDSITKLEKQLNILKNEMGILPHSRELHILYNVKYHTINDDIERIKGRELIEKLEGRKLYIPSQFPHQYEVIALALKQLNKEIDDINKNKVSYVRKYCETDVYFPVSLFFNKIV